MSIFNIELDFVKDNERLAKISVISYIIILITIILAVVLSAYLIILDIHDILKLPLYELFMIISTAIFVGSSVHLYSVRSRFNALKDEKTREKAREFIMKSLKKIVVLILVGAIIMAAISFILPSYKNVSYNLSPGEVINLNQSLIFDSALIHGVFVSGNGVTLIYGNDGSVIVVNDSFINPNSEIVLYEYQGYKIIQKSGSSNIVVQYAGNYDPYYAALIVEILSIIPSLFFIFKFRRGR